MKKFERIKAAIGRFVDTVSLPLGALSGVSIGVVAQKYGATPNPFRNEAIDKVGGVIAACAFIAFIFLSYLGRKSRYKNHQQLF